MRRLPEGAQIISVIIMTIVFIKYCVVPMLKLSTDRPSMYKLNFAKSPRIPVTLPVNYTSERRVTYRTDPLNSRIDVDNGMVLLSNGSYASVTRLLETPTSLNTPFDTPIQYHILDEYGFAITQPRIITWGIDVRTMVLENQVWAYTHVHRVKGMPGKLIPCLVNLYTNEKFVLDMSTHFKHPNRHVPYGKSYTFFEYNGDLYFIYSFDPPIIFKVDFTRSRVSKTSHKEDVYVLTVNLVVGDLKQQFNSSSLRGSTQGYYFNDKTVVGIGHTTGRGHEQHPKWWTLDMTSMTFQYNDLRMNEKLYEYRKKQGRKTLIWPLSIVEFKDSLYMTATESDEHWWKIMRDNKFVEFPESRIRNIMFKLE